MCRSDTDLRDTTSRSDASGRETAMIVLIATPNHGFTVKCFADGTYGFPAPDIRAASYEQMWRAAKVPRATYIFADIERLSAWELLLASDLYRVMRDAGLTCLNNPAYVMARVELLHALHAAGVNRFTAWRADERPRPARFPVFVRGEGDHSQPIARLIADQRQLDKVLADMQAQAIPRRGNIVVEVCAEPYAPGLWAKWGTFRVGDLLSVDHIGVDDAWFVKYGDHEKLTEDAIRDEHEAVASNRYAADVRPAFDIGHIEYGRADHATVEGRPAVYEVNTNPFIGPYVPDGHPLRRETQRLARERLAASLAQIDTPASGMVDLPVTKLRAGMEALPPRFMTPRP